MGVKFANPPLQMCSWKTSKECKSNLECKKKVKCEANRLVTIGQSWLNMQAVPLAGNIF